MIAQSHASKRKEIINHTTQDVSRESNCSKPLYHIFYIVKESLKNTMLSHTEKILHTTDRLMMILLKYE